MYTRALRGYKSTLLGVNNRAPQGYEDALSVELASTYLTALNTMFALVTSFRKRAGKTW